MPLFLLFKIAVQSSSGRNKIVSNDKVEYLLKKTLKIRELLNQKKVNSLKICMHLTKVPQNTEENMAFKN